MRFSALQNVTINLPRIAYKAHGSDQALFMELNRTLELVAKAHVQKRAFIQELFDLGDEGPLGMLTQNLDGAPYLKMDQLTYLAGLIGLNELVQVHTGEQLHESDERPQVRVEGHLGHEPQVQGALRALRHQHRPRGESGRVGRLPAGQARHEVLAGADRRGRQGRPRQAANYYYTNSIHLAVDAPIDYIERVEKQSRFHPLIEAGAIVHVWLGESEPDPRAIESLRDEDLPQHAVLRRSHSAPSSRCARSCRRTRRGLKSQCPLCGSLDVYGVTRIVGYFSKVQTWNQQQGRRAVRPGPHGPDGEFPV